MKIKHIFVHLKYLIISIFWLMQICHMIRKMHSDCTCVSLIQIKYYAGFVSWCKLGENYELRKIQKQTIIMKIWSVYLKLTRYLCLIAAHLLRYENFFLHLHLRLFITCIIISNLAETSWTKTFAIDHYFNELIIILYSILMRADSLRIWNVKRKIKNLYSN